MKDKVQLIRQEIERRIKEISDACDGVIMVETISVEYNTLCNIRDYINSLPEKPKKQPKFKVGDTIKGPCNNIFQVKEVLDKQYLLHSENGDELNSIEIVDKYSCILEEPASEDLDIAATSIIKRLGGMEKDDCVSEHELKIFKAAIDWQKKKDQETIELAEDHAMLAGMNKMKEEMMKDAVIAWVNTYESVTNPYDNEVSFITNLSPSKFKNKETVKIVIVKEN